MKLFAGILILFSLLNSICYAENSSSPFQWEAKEKYTHQSPLNSTLPNTTFVTSIGSLSVNDLVNDGLFLIAVRDPDCPLSRKYAHKLNNFKKNGLNIIYLLVGDQANIATANRDQQRHQIDGIYILDSDKQLSTWLGIETSAEVFLFNKSKVLKYRGAIDDQHGIGFNKQQATNTYLIDAIKAIEDGLDVQVAATSAPGCIIRQTHKINESQELTWHEDISPLILEKCSTCHRPGQAGPFSLITYKDIYQRKEMVRFVLENKIMPPWSIAGDISRFENEKKYLADSDRKKIIQWIDSGAHEGNKTDSVIESQWTSGWKYGEPDFILHSPKELDIPSDGEIDYYYVSIPTNFSQDRYVHTVEIATDTPENTHHIIIFVLPPEQLQDKIMPGIKKSTILTRKEYGLMSINGLFSGFIPGFPGLIYQNGTGKLLPKGWRIVMQVHYESNGKAAKDRPRVGLHFLDSVPEKVIKTLSAVNFEISIPANTSEHLETAEYKFKSDGEIVGLYPHMHLRGSAFKYEIKTPNGQTETILDVPHYDPNWQQYYQFREPLKISKNSTLIAYGWFDNSASNLNNPDPSVDVKFGLRTKDEMLIGYFDWVQNNYQSQ